MRTTWTEWTKWTEGSVICLRTAFVRGGFGAFGSSLKIGVAEILASEVCLPEIGSNVRIFLSPFIPCLDTSFENFEMFFVGHCETAIGS